jgi:hypothetical protein
MAVMALALAGSAIGAAIGGTVLGVSAATIGFVAGEVAGNLLFPQKQTSEGPRVGDLSVQSSTYGSPIPIIFGTMRVAGNVIFSTAKREVKNEQTSGGKGGPKVTTTTYTYNIDMAVALCEGPIEGIRKMWLNGKLVYDASTGATITSSVASSIHAEGWKVYLGDETQLPDPTMEATVGVGNVPGYRGMAYVVFDHLDCPNGQVPQLSFEIVASGTSGPSSITFEQVPAPAYPNFALASIVENRVWQFVGNNGAQPAYSAGPGFFSNEGVRLFSTPVGGDHAPISVQGGPYALFYSDAPGPSYETPRSQIVVNLETGVTTVPLVFTPGISGNALAPAFAAYDPISGDFCAVNGGNSLLDPRSASITIFSSNTLTDVLMTPSTPMAFYNSVIYTCGTNAGETFLNSYDTTGALIDSVGAGQDCGFAGNLIVHASGSGVYVVQGASNPATVDRKVWKVTGGAWVLLCATAHYDNSADSAWTYWTNDFYGIFGPSSASGGNVTYTTVRYESFDSDDVPVGDIIEAVCERAGLDISQIDTADCTDTVHGFAISQVAPARNTIDPIVRTFFVDAIETDGELKFERRAGKSVVATIPYDDLGTTAGDQAIDPFPMARTQEAELPRSVSLTYYNWASDYQPGTEMARRQVTSSVNDLTDQLPIATSPDQMAAAAATLLYDAWAMRTMRAASLPRSYAYLDVGDNVSVEYPRGSHSNKRLAKITDTGQLIQVEMVDSDPSVYSLTVPGATPANPQVGVEYIAPTKMVLLDIPILRDVDNNAGLYGAFAGLSSDWNGTVVFRADAAGVFSQAGSVTSAGAIGTALTALGDWTPNFVDETNTVDVQMVSGTLSSITRDQMLDTDANACVIGSEVIQFRTATSLGGGQYRLSGLLRHLRGTEWATSVHAAGDRFVLLQTTGMLRFTMDVSEVGASRKYKAKSIGGADETNTTFTNTAIGLKPFAPVNPRRITDIQGSVGYQWDRRTRLADNWLAGSVPLGEDTEAYDVELLDVDGSILYSDQVTAAEWFPPASAATLGQAYGAMGWAFQSYSNSVYAIAWDFSDPTANSKLIQFTPSGDVAASSDLLGQSITQTVTNGSDLYFTSASYNTVGGLSGGFVKRFSLGDLSNPATYTAATAGDPSGIAYDGTNVWIAERFSGNVRKLDPITLSSIASFAIATGMEAMSYDGSSNFWISRRDSNEILKVSTSGVLVSRFPCISSPGDVLYHNGKVIVLGSSSVAIYTTAGVEVGRVAVNAGTLPQRLLVKHGAAQIAVLSDFAVNAFRQSIFIINTSDATLAEVIPSPYAHINGLSGDASGNLYVTGTPKDGGGRSNLLAIGSLEASTFRVYQRSVQVGRGYPAELTLG